MIARYNRISTKEQNIENQSNKALVGETNFSDVCSGSIEFANRIQAKQLIKAIGRKEINEVKVYDISRLGRNLKDVITTIDYFTENNVNLFVENLAMYSLDNNGKKSNAFTLVTSIMATIAEMERNTMLERQSIGIINAKANGKYLGRLKGALKSNDMFLGQNKEVVKKLQSDVRYTLKDIATITGKSISTIQKVKRILKEQQ